MYVTFPGCSTKTSAYICSFYTVAIKVASITVALLITFKTEEYESIRESISGHPYKVKRDFYPFAAVHCMMYLISAIILYYGVKNNNPKLLMPHMFETVIDVGIKMLLFMVLMIEGTTEGLLGMFFMLPILLLFFAVLIYEILVVASHYHYLVTREEKKLYPMDATTKLKEAED